MELIGLLMLLILSSAVTAFALLFKGCGDKFDGSFKEPEIILIGDTTASEKSVEKASKLPPGTENKGSRKKKKSAAGNSKSKKGVKRIDPFTDTVSNY